MAIIIVERKILQASCHMLNEGVEYYEEEVPSALQRLQQRLGIRRRQIGAAPAERADTLYAALRNSSFNRRHRRNNNFFICHGRNIRRRQMKGGCMNELVIYPGKFKLFLIAFGSLIFACGGIGIAIWQDELRMPAWKFVMASWVGIPFFLFCFGYACYRLFVPKPAVIVNNQGIFDNASALSAGMVKWDEIDRIFVHKYKNQNFLGIIPVDSVAFLRRQPVLKRWLMKVNIRLVEAPINIPQNTLPLNVVELLSKIQEYRRHQAG